MKDRFFVELDGVHRSGPRLARSLPLHLNARVAADSSDGTGENFLGVSLAARSIRRRAWPGEASSWRKPSRCWPSATEIPSACGRLLVVSPAKKRSLTSSALRRVLGLQGRQGLVEGEQVDAGVLDGELDRVEVDPLAAAAALWRRPSRRAFSTRMRRIASAAAAKKWPRLSQPRRRPCRRAGGTPRGPGPWPGASGRASPAPASGRRACAAPRRPAAGVARPPGGRPARSPRGCGSRRSLH